MRNAGVYTKKMRRIFLGIDVYCDVKLLFFVHISLLYVWEVEMNEKFVCESDV